jgi:Transposase DDE domain
MEHQLWQAIVSLLSSLDKTPSPTRHTFADSVIVAVYYWAVTHDRPVSWACQNENWPPHLRRESKPSDSTMSRRLRKPSVVALLSELERRVSAPREPGVFWVIDGKPLVIGGASGDSDAGCGRAVRGLARGYKLHVLANARGELAAWEVAPMNVDERRVAGRLVRAACVHGYIVADANYDSNPLHDQCEQLGNRQLLTPRRYRAARGLGHHRHSPGRLRCRERLENPRPDFARQLLHERDAVERTFGNLTNWGGGLTVLPPWVRRLRRVTRWVQAKIALRSIKRQRDTSTYVA